MIEGYRYLNDLSPQKMNDILKLRKNAYDLTNIHLLESNVHLLLI